VAYMAKAAHEEKLRTSWTDPDEQYEAELTRFARVAIETFRGDTLPDLRELREAIEWYGALDGLTQSLLRLAVPGVPDIYQGCELWNLSLVDPDNRRPVDWQLRDAMLSELLRQHASAPVGVAREAWMHAADGRCKLLLTTLMLQLRQARPDLFRRGAYEPLEVDGIAAAR